MRLIKTTHTFTGWRGNVGKFVNSMSATEGFGPSSFQAYSLLIPVDQRRQWLIKTCLCSRTSRRKCIYNVIKSQSRINILKILVLVIVGQGDSSTMLGCHVLLHLVHEVGHLLLVEL